jgi:hypothetical protein
MSRRQAQFSKMAAIRPFREGTNLFIKLSRVMRQAVSYKDSSNKGRILGEMSG